MKEYFNRRLLAILVTSFASGLPLLLTRSTMQAWYTVSGINLMLIGSLSLVGLPYTFKFLWAPLLDRFTPFKLGRRRSWLFLMQVLVGIGLVLMTYFDPSTSPRVLVIIAFAVAFCSATQDIAVDAYRTDVLQTKERGMGASLLAIGYRVAMVISGAVALIIADHWGWQPTYFFMALLMFAAATYTLFIPKVDESMGAPKKISEAFMKPVIELMARPYIIAIIVFIVIYKLCDAFALSLNTVFLIRHLHFSLSDVGYISKTVSIAAVFIGSILGGVLLPRIGMYRSLFYFGFLQMSSNLLFAQMVIVGKNYWLMAGSLFVDNFCGGLSTVAFVAFLMALCDKRYTATQYAIFSSLMSVGITIAGPLAAYLVLHIGWFNFYILTFFMGVPSLVLLKWLRSRLVLLELSNEAWR